MNRRQRKSIVREFVDSRNIPDLVEMARGDGRVIGTLCALLYEPNDRLRWRAIEALGEVATVTAATNLESVRELLRRLEWLMNDESGGAGWHSPEAMAAIVLGVPAFIDVFGLLLGSYLNDAPLKRGAHWAVAAISQERPDLFSDRVDELAVSLKSSDPFIRGCAVVGLSVLGGDSVVEALEPLREDAASLEFYNRGTGEMRTRTVGELVKLATSGAVGPKTPIDVW